LKKQMEITPRKKKVITPIKARGKKMGDSVGQTLEGAGPPPGFEAGGAEGGGKRPKVRASKGKEFWGGVKRKGEQMGGGGEHSNKKRREGKKGERKRTILVQEGPKNGKGGYHRKPKTQRKGKRSRGENTQKPN